MVFKDYIIVGDGFAAMFFAHHLIKEGKSFYLFSNGKRSASQVSAGIINPVVLKKFNTFSRAQEQINNLHSVLNKMETYIGKNFLVPEMVQRIIHDENEKKLWLKKAAEANLAPFLSAEFQNDEYVKNPYGVGAVLQSARLDVESFFAHFFTYLDSQGHLIKKQFNFDLLKPLENTYDDEIHYGKIVFCEGVSVLKNPYFKNIPVVPNKGHQLNVRISGFDSFNKTYKKKHFLFPLHSGLYYYGGTYDRHQTEDGIDNHAVTELRNGLEEIIDENYSVESVNYGFRPTVADRKPILGESHLKENFFVFNGLGARGILNASYYAPFLFDYAENSTPLPPEVDLKRFDK